MGEGVGQSELRRQTTFGGTAEEREKEINGYQSTGNSIPKTRGSKTVTNFYLSILQQQLDPSQTTETIECYGRTRYAFSRGDQGGQVQRFQDQLISFDRYLSGPWNPLRRNMSHCMRRRQAAEVGFNFSIKLCLMPEDLISSGRSVG